MLGKRLIAGFHHCTKHHSCSKSAMPKHIINWRSTFTTATQWRSWRTGSAAYDFTESFTGRARCPGNQKLGIWPENWPYLDLYDT